MNPASPIQNFFGLKAPPADRQGLQDAGHPSIEVGIRFTPARNGFVTGARFFKSANEPAGTAHFGTLWRYSTQEQLASIQFQNECSGAGWQEQAFTSPAYVQAGIEYVVSVGQVFFCAVANELLTAQTSLNGGDLTTTVGSNDVFKYQATSTPTPIFPSDAAPAGEFGSPNYYVDVEFVAATAVTFTSPRGLAFDTNGGLYVADTGDSVVRQIACQAPTGSPSSAPSATPTVLPSGAPSKFPTTAPTAPTGMPTKVRRSTSCHDHDKIRSSKLPAVLLYPSLSIGTQMAGRLAMPLST